jgi:3-hydroxyisobutyrate dehydrogenase
MTIRVAFLGLGRMGSGMASCLIRAGHEVSVFNRNIEKARAVKGARVCTSAREAASGAEAIVTMTANDESSRAVWTAADGVLAADIAANAFAIECSTLSYDWVKRLSSEVASCGLRYIDAPVTGLPAAAAAGELTLLVGASAQDLEAARPLLAAFSNRIFHFGAVGTGTAYKLTINMMGAVQIAAAAEGMAMAERAGLDLRVVADAIATSQAASPQVVRNTRRMAEDEHNQNVAFTPVLRLKDVDYALQLARQLNLATPFGEVARMAFQQLIHRGHADSNESKVFEVARAAHH